MSAPTKTYRVCCYDATRHIVAQDWVEASSDDDAVAQAEAAGFGTQCEIWDGHRLVATLRARAA